MATKYPVSFSKETGCLNNSVLHNYEQFDTVPIDGVLIGAYKGTRRKHNMKFKQIGHTLCSMDNRFSLKLLVHETPCFR